MLKKKKSLFTAAFAIVLLAQAVMCQTAAQSAISQTAGEYGLGSPRPESPQARQTPAPRGEGWWQAFERGWVYWHPNYGAQLVRGKIFEKWGGLQWEQGTLGFPRSGESQCREPDSADRYQIFEGGRIYWRASTNEAFAFKNPTSIGDNGKCAPAGQAPSVALPPRPTAAAPPDSSIVRRTRPQGLKIWLSTTAQDGALSGMRCENNLRAVATGGDYIAVTRWENLADNSRPAIFDYDTRYPLLACRHAPIIERVEGTNAVRFGPRMGSGDRTPIPSALSVNLQGAFADNTPYTIFAVVERNNSNNNNYFFSTWPEGPGDAPDSRISVGWKWDRTLTLDQWRDFVDMTVSPRGTVRSLIVAAGDGQTLFVSLDETGQSNSAVKTQGVRPLRHTYSATIGAGGSGIGGLDALGFFEGNVYEIIVYNERLNKAEIEGIKDYLIRRFVRP